MAKTCEICKKGPTSGIKYKRRGMIRRKGGAGSKIVGKTLRQFQPNLQRIRIMVDKTVKRSYVCTGCIKKGLVTKAV